MSAAFPELRDAGPGDLPAVLSLLSQLDAEGRTCPEPEEAWRELHALPGLRVRLALDGGVPVGTYTLLLLPGLSHGGAGTALVENVVVDASRRGQGIGERMMREAAALACEAGCYKLALTSGLSRDSAHRFYESLGFRRHGHSYLLPLETD